MNATKPTVADAYGDEIADRLARWAIDALVAPPEKIATGTTRISTSLVARGREILDDSGWDWRGWKRENHAGTSSRAAARRAS
jgi:hypothetical protein